MPCLGEVTTTADIIQTTFTAHVAVAQEFVAANAPAIETIGNRLVACLKAGGKILWCGNGGSAADAQHMAAELIGRYKKERPARASIALTTDTSILTSIGNDYGFDQIFVRQVQGLMTDRDVLISLSTSGNSPNVIEAVRAARKLGGYTVCLLGKDGGRLKDECDVGLIVPSNETARIQEMHNLVGHLWCDLIDYQLV